MTTTACAICSGNGMHLRYPEAIDYLTGDRFEVWTCTVCGSGRTEPVPGNLHRHYPPRYRQYHLAIKWILQLLYHHRVKRWARLFSRPGTAFEMGCGDAMMLASLSRLGWQVLGSERTEESAAAARMKSGLPIVVGGPEAIDPTARFDLIVLNQVLEHLDAPGAVITQLAGMLAPGGKLVIDVPNFASWQSLFGGTGWFHLDVPRHLHHFTRPSLTLLLRRHGLKVTAVSYVSPEHDVFGWVQSILNLLDLRTNRLTRLLMRIDPPAPVNLLHLAAGCLLGILAVPLSVITWIMRRGALIEIVATQCDAKS